MRKNISFLQKWSSIEILASFSHFTGFSAFISTKNMSKIMNKKEIKLRIRTIQLYEWRIAVCEKKYYFGPKIAGFRDISQF